MGRRAFSEHDVQVAAALVRAGTPTADIAKELGWAASTINRQLLARGIHIPCRKRVYTPARGKLLEEALARGRVRDALAEVGISYETYRRWLAQGLINYKKTRRTDAEYTRIYERYVSRGESPAQLAQIYRIKHHTLLSAWRRLGLPIDMARSRRQAAQKYRQGVYMPSPDELARVWRRYAAGELNAAAAARTVGIGWERLRQLWVDAGYPMDAVARKKIDKNYRRGKREQA